MRQSNFRRFFRRRSRRGFRRHFRRYFRFRNFRFRNFRFRNFRFRNFHRRRRGIRIGRRLAAVANDDFADFVDFRKRFRKYTQIRGGDRDDDE